MSEQAAQYDVNAIMDILDPPPDEAELDRICYLINLRYELCCALSHREATPVTGQPGWVDLRITAEELARLKEAGE